MHAHRMVHPAAILVLGALATGCAETTSAVPGTTTVTSAEAQRDEIAKLERERDEARALLEDERTAREQERHRYSTEVAVLRQQDELRLHALDAVEKADRDIQALRDKSARATVKQKKAIETTIAQAQELKTKLNASIRDLKGDIDKSFESVRSEVESTIKELDQSLSSGNESPETKKEMKKEMKKK